MKTSGNKKYLGKTIRKTNRKGKNGKTIRKNNRKCGGGNGEEIKKKIETYLYGLPSTTTKDADNLEMCVVPESKGGQDIHVCYHHVYKSPPKGAVPKIVVNENEKTIRIDGYTMNLLIQSIIKDTELNTVVECYDHLEIINGDHENSFYKTLVGKKYSFDYCDKNGKSITCLSVEDFIQYMNADYLNPNNNDVCKTNEDKIEILVQWIMELIITLNKLWEKFQLHHCDPKAAQLFINGTWKENHVILGDLDSVTFTIKIGKTCYRVCSSGYFEKTVEYLGKTASKKTGSISNSLVNATKPILNYFPGFRNKSTSGGGLLPSFAEYMRSNSKPNANNYRETAAFICSVLVLIDDKTTRQNLYDALEKQSDNKEENKYSRTVPQKMLKETLGLIKIGELLKVDNTTSLKERKSHKLACNYVKDSYSKQFPTPSPLSSVWDLEENIKTTENPATKNNM